MPIPCFHGRIIPFIILFNSTNSILTHPLANNLFLGLTRKKLGVQMTAREVFPFSYMQ